MESTRVMPSILRTGDSLIVKYTAPPEVDDENWVRADLYLERVQKENDYDRDDYTYDDQSLVDRGAEFRVAGAITDAYVDGIYRYKVTFTSDASTPTVTTVESGVLDVVDSLNPVSSFNERMVAIIESVIETKMQSRSDVMMYELDNGMKIHTLTPDQLQEMLHTYEQRLLIEQGKKVYF